MTRHRRHRIHIKDLARWHRITGLVSAVFVLLLAVTGVMLNHTDGLGLDRTYVQTRSLLDWYGVRIPAEPVSYPAGDAWLSQIGERVYFNDRELPGHHDQLLGAVAFADMLVVAVNGGLIVLTAGGELVEVLGREHGVPAGIQRIGRAGSGVAVRAAHGTYWSDADLIKWTERKTVPAEWAEPRTTPAALHPRLVAAYLGKGLPLERVLRDLHSGRILGHWGRLLMDAAALVFVLLTASGLWIWSRRGK